ncbi:MAG TPA: STAS domain-containing protein [Candidatus Acidoferrales bacterium]|jgi:anti-anti-sigma factor|nr:STAS domain-containing protein [Candidatus Acidoferrales bacterium]
MVELPSSSTRGFRVHCYEQEDALVAECHGKLTFENTQVLKDSVRERIPGHKRIVIDLKEVPQVDSSGLGAVVGLYVSARTRGCQLEVVNASQQVRDLFSMTNLLSLFEPAGRHHGKSI